MQGDKKWTLHPLLDRILSEVSRDGVKVTFKDYGRTFREHIEIYKRKAARRGEAFDIDKVPLGSRHLPCFNTLDLRAVDIAMSRNGKYLTGEECEDEIYRARERLGGRMHVGIGVPQFGLHVDVYRDKDARWTYD